VTTTTRATDPGAARAVDLQRSAPVTAPTSRWYQDAVIYEVHVRAFQDRNADGIGDFGGLVERLDHVRDLGATAIWLLPFYPSPLRDDGSARRTAATSA
jgi:maltose alpha-D-glucosyltransferase / alpha-amylase